MKSTEAYGILTAAGHRDPVSVDVVADVLGVSNSEASDTISGMVVMGLATRIRRGLVLLKPPAELGTPTLGDDVYRAAIALTDPDHSYIGFYTALHHHALVTRPATTVYVASVPRRRSRTLADTPIKFITVNPTRLFGIETVAGVPWSDPERTLVDALARPEYCGQLDGVIGAFQRYSAELNTARLRAYVERLGVAAVAKRAEYILWRLGSAQTAPAALATGRQRHYTLLDPHGPTAGNPIPEFEILDNVAAAAWHDS